MMSTDLAVARPRNRLGSKLGVRLAELLVEEIVANEMAQGDMLPSELKLQEIYGVGRAAVREALRLLEAQGVVTVRPGPGGGPMVSDTSSSGAVHLADAMRLQLQLRGATYQEVIAGRMAIEPYLARLAAERHNAAGVEQLSDLLERAAEADPADVDTFQALAYRFHQLLGALSGNRLVALQAEVLIEIFESQFAGRITLPLDSRQWVVGRWHRISEAVISGQLSAAERRMRGLLESLTDLIARNYADLASEPIRWHD
jgi:DNA-binding FadR family transcriptional regulator